MSIRRFRGDVCNIEVELIFDGVGLYGPQRRCGPFMMTRGKGVKPEGLFAGDVEVVALFWVWQINISILLVTTSRQMLDVL